MPTVKILLHQEQPIHPQAVRALYTAMNWWPERTEEQIAQILTTHIAIGAWDKKRLIGFARIISDHCFHAYIEDVMIHPAYQRQSIGKRLISRLLEAIAHIETVTLFCEVDLIPFYEKLDFRALPAQVVMHRKNDRNFSDAHPAHTANT